MEAQSKIQNRVIVLKHGGAPLVAEGFADDLRVRRLIPPFPSPLQDISFAVPSDAPWQLRPCRI